MNKKLFFGLFAAVGLLFAVTFASCTQEEITADSTVRFSLQAPAATTALSDASGINLLVWAVYDKDGNKIDALCDEKANAFQTTPLRETVPFQLAKGQTYTVVFWAQNSACTVYDYSDLKNIHYTDVTALVGNDETRDAFFGSHTFTVDGNMNQEVTLKRPFAQLNFATPQSELDALTTTITGSTVKISEVGTGFNAMTGEITSSTTDVEIAAATAFAEDITLTLEGTTSTYKHLSMNYILVNDATPTGATSVTADVTFTFITAADPIVIESTNTPLQRNWRTNIIGSLTNTGDFDVTITPGFDNENNVTEPAEVIADGVTRYKGEYSISNGNGLAYASANLFALGGVFNITKDIDMTGVAYTTIQKGVNQLKAPLTINGKKHTISNLKVVGGIYGAFLGYVSHNTNINDLTIENSTFAADNNQDGEYSSAAFMAWVTEGSTVNLNNCKSINNIIGSAKYVGGLVGFFSSYDPKNITNCQVIGGTITSEYTEDGGTNYKGHCGGLVGASYVGTITNSTIQNTIITVKGTRGGAVVGSIIGGTTLLGEGIVVDNVTFNAAKATAANICGSVNNTNTPTDGVIVK